MVTTSEILVKVGMRGDGYIRTGCMEKMEMIVFHFPLIPIIVSGLVAEMTLFMAAPVSTGWRVAMVTTSFLVVMAMII